MTDLGPEQDDLVRRLAVKHHLPESVALPTSPAAEELLNMITSTSEPDLSRAPQVHHRAPWWSRRRLLVGAAATAAVAVTAGIVAVVMATTPGVVLPPDSPGGPAPAHADALEIVAEDDYVEISINDPTADPERYRAEVAEYGFDIELNLAPAYPDKVGRVIFMEVGDTGTDPTLEVIEAPGECAADGGCLVVIRVPVGFSSYANIVFGRTPIPNESFEGDAPVLTPEENELLAALIGMRVADARTVLADRGWTAEYRVGEDSRGATAEEVPGDWYVTDVAPLDGGVVLWADPDPSR